MDTLAQEIGILLKKYKLSLGTVESATGGLISHLITNIPGSSDYYKGSIIAYSNEIKIGLVGVKQETLDNQGAVSSQVAEEMAEGGRRVLGVDICLSDTGIAGPTGATKDKPLGLFYLGLSHHDQAFNRKYLFQDKREENKEQAAVSALKWLKEYLNSLETRKEQATVYRIKEVVTCILESENKILILRRSAKVGSYQGRWAGVSGYAERSPDEQSLTEIREETGLDSKEVRLLVKGSPQEVIDKNLKIRWIVYPYLFHVKSPGNIKMDWEHTEIKWIQPDEIDNYETVPKLKEVIKALFPKAEQNK